MCTETFEVVGLDDEREAYEVEQYLIGLPYIDVADADFLSDNVVVEYDESIVDEDTVLDEIENSGCKPSKRVDGFIDKLKLKLSGL